MSTVRERIDPTVPVQVVLAATHEPMDRHSCVHVCWGLALPTIRLLVKINIYADGQVGTNISISTRLVVVVVREKSLDSDAVGHC
jgi:hypothetical protein